MMLHLHFSLCLILLACFSACNRAADSASKQAPAKVEQHPSEPDIYQITLTEKAVERLGITTFQVEMRNMQRRREFAGDVIVTPGQSALVSAPVAGTITAPQNADIPLAGHDIQAGDELFSLQPILSPERDVPTTAERVQMANAQASLVSAQITAEGDLQQADAEVAAAQVALARAKQLLETGAGSVRALDEAQALLDISEKKRNAAQTRKEVLESLSLESNATDVVAIPLLAPQGGVLRVISVVSGQTVIAGAPLCEIVDLDRVWIRVPIYAGQLAQINQQAEGTVTGLSGDSSRAAVAIKAPPEAEAQSVSVYLYYQIENKDARFRPGERVTISLPFTNQGEAAVIPWAAVLHDVNGVTWVYRKSDDRVFRRQRVFVEYVAGDMAVLQSGPATGTEIVVDGAAELFGTEFGAGK